MVTMPSTEAKTHFGALLDRVQREPVTIEKKGRAVAVMISESDYEVYQNLKLEALQRDLMSGLKEADSNELIDSEAAFKGLL